MPGNGSGLEPAALELLLNAVETPEAAISGAVLDDYHASDSIILKETGLLKLHGHEDVSVSGADHDDVPVTLSWSAEDGGLGYFSPTAGWINVPEDRIARFRVDFSVLLARLMIQADVSSRSGPTPLIPDLLWEIGDVRLGRRTQRVPIWFARRLHERSVWRQVKDMAKARPTTGLRVVLTSTPSNRFLDEAIAGHLLVGIRDVIDFASGLAVHPDILAARLDGSHQPDVEEALYLSPDGKQLLINGDVTIRFRSAPHIVIIRKLVTGFREGKRFTARELVDLTQLSSNTLRQAFGAKKWAQLKSYIKTRDGLWGFEL
jgi:hypothetical protein